MSKSNAKWRKIYKTCHEIDPWIVREASTGKQMCRKGLERHHICGRKGNHILIYCYLLPDFHTWIHAHAKDARIMGWLLPQFEGRPHEPNHPKPWAKGSLVNEQLLNNT